MSLNRKVFSEIFHYNLGGTKKLNPIKKVGKKVSEIKHLTEEEIQAYRDGGYVVEEYPHGGEHGSLPDSTLLWEQSQYQNSFIKKNSAGNNVVENWDEYDPKKYGDIKEILNRTGIEPSGSTEYFYGSMTSPAYIDVFDKPVGTAPKPKGTLDRKKSINVNLMQSGYATDGKSARAFKKKLWEEVYPDTPYKATDNAAQNTKLNSWILDNEDKLAEFSKTGSTKAQVKDSGYLVGTMLGNAQEPETPFLPTKPVRKLERDPSFDSIEVNTTKALQKPREWNEMEVAPLPKVTPRPLRKSMYSEGGEVMNLTDLEIAEYEKGGYTVEKYHEGGAVHKHPHAPYDRYLDNSNVAVSDNTQPHNYYPAPKIPKVTLPNFVTDKVFPITANTNTKKYPKSTLIEKDNSKIKQFVNENKRYLGQVYGDDLYNEDGSYNYKKLASTNDLGKIVEDAKYAEFSKNEQEAYDAAPFYEKAANAVTATIADPMLTIRNAIFEGKGPMMGQWKGLNDEGNENERFYKNATGYDDDWLNSGFNFINPLAYTGEAVLADNAFDAGLNLATALSMGSLSGLTKPLASNLLKAEEKVVNTVLKTPSLKALKQTPLERLNNPELWKTYIGTKSGGIRGKIAKKAEDLELRWDVFKQNKVDDKVFRKQSAYKKTPEYQAEIERMKALRPNSRIGSYNDPKYPGHPWSDGNRRIIDQHARSQAIKDKYEAFRRNYSGLPIEPTKMGGGQGRIYKNLLDESEYIKLGKFPGGVDDLENLIDVGRKLNIKPGMENVAFPTKATVINPITNLLSRSILTTQHMPKLPGSVGRGNVKQTSDLLKQIRKLDKKGVGVDYQGSGNIMFDSATGKYQLVDLNYVGEPANRLKNTFAFNRLEQTPKERLADKFGQKLLDEADEFEKLRLMVPGQSYKFDDGGQVLDLTDLEIAEYEKSGYVIEEYADGGEHGDILTYKDNADYFDSHTNLHENSAYNKQIKERVYSGNWGFNPKDGTLHKLGKDDRVKVSSKTRALSKAKPMDKAVKPNQSGNWWDNPNHQPTQEETNEFVRMGVGKANSAFKDAISMVPGVETLADAAGLVDATVRGDKTDMGIYTAGLSLPFVPGRLLKKGKEAFKKIAKGPELPNSSGYDVSDFPKIKNSANTSDPIKALQKQYDVDETTAKKYFELEKRSSSNPEIRREYYDKNNLSPIEGDPDAYRDLINNPQAYAEFKNKSDSPLVRTMFDKIDEPSVVPGKNAVNKNSALSDDVLNDFMSQSDDASSLAVKKDPWKIEPAKVSTNFSPPPKYPELNNYQDALNGMKETGKYWDNVGISGSKMLNPNTVKYHGMMHSRPVVEVKMPDGNSQYFYKSTGGGGKSHGTGEWAPYGGFGRITHPQHKGIIIEDWFIKGNGYEDKYGSKTFQDISKELDGYLMKQEGLGSVDELNKSMGFRTFKNGGEIKHLTKAQIKKYRDGGYIVEEY